MPADLISNTLMGLLILSILWQLRRLELQGRRTGQAIIALAQEMGTPGAEQAAWLLVPEKKRPKP